MPVTKKGTHAVQCYMRFVGILLLEFAKCVCTPGEKQGGYVMGLSETFKIFSFVCVKRQTCKHKVENSTVRLVFVILVLNSSGLCDIF